MPSDIEYMDDKEAEEVPELHAGLSRASTESYGGALNVVYIVDPEDDPMADASPDPNAERPPDKDYIMLSEDDHFGEPRGPVETMRRRGVRQSARLQSRKRARDTRSSLPSRPTHPGGQAREDPIVISSDSDSHSDSEDDELEGDGVVGPRIPVWVYKMKPAAPSGDPSVASRESAGAGASSSSDRGVSVANTRKPEHIKPGACGGLVQRKTRRGRPPKVRGARSGQVVARDLPVDRGCGHTPRQAPPQLEEALPDLQARYPGDLVGVGYRSLTDDTIKWGYRCLTCPDAPVISGGNIGISRANMLQHLAGPKHRRPGTKSHCRGGAPAAAPVRRTRPRAASRAASSRPPRAASTSPAASVSQSATVVQSSPGGATPGPSSHPTAKAPRKDPDEVEGFLSELGLTRELAGALRSVGIKDRGRMRILGGAPDAMLDRLEASLAGAGLDVSECMIVRLGLQRCATAAGTVR